MDTKHKLVSIIIPGSSLYFTNNNSVSTSTTHHSQHMARQLTCFILPRVGFHAQSTRYTSKERTMSLTQHSCADRAMSPMRNSASVPNVHVNLCILPTPFDANIYETKDGEAYYKSCLEVVIMVYIINVMRPLIFCSVLYHC